MVEFRATDALAFADAFRFGRRMDPSDLDAKIQAERTSGAMGPAALPGLSLPGLSLRAPSKPWFGSRWSAIGERRGRTRVTFCVQML